MNEKPILFSAPMVRAILTDQKTETRRIIAPQPGEEWNGLEIRCHFYNPTAIDRHGEEYPGEEIFGFADTDSGWKCPYGAPGDRLWIREGFCYVQGDGRDADFGIKYLSDDTIIWWRDNAGEMNYPIDQRKRPSIFMPRKFSRITLEILNIEVKRLQNMILPDYNAEGFGIALEFTVLWNRIHRKDRWTWDKNPWVWIIQFKRIKST